MPIVEPKWGPDVIGSWRQLEEPAQALIIGPGSEVDAVLVKHKQLGDLVCSVDRPLLDLPLAKGTLIRPLATRGLAVADFTAFVTSPNSRSQPMYARLELYAFDRPLSMPPILARSPRHFDRATYTTTASGLLVEAWHTRGAKRFRLILDNATGTDGIHWRVAAHRYGTDGATPDKDNAPIFPTGGTIATPNWSTLAADTVEQYNFNLVDDECDMVALYAKVQDAGTPVLGYQALVRD